MKRYRAFDRFQPSINTSNRADVADQKSRANEYFHSELISKLKDGYVDSTSKSYVYNNVWQNQ